MKDDAVLPWKDLPMADPSHMLNGHLATALSALVLAGVFLFSFSAFLTPAEADHGTFSVWQESRDAGSCCVEVRGWARCSTNCGWIESDIKKSGQWYLAVCDTRPNDNCFQKASVWRTYSYPITVTTKGFYIGGTSHSGGSGDHNVYYP